MNLDKADKRDKKRDKRRHGMRVNGKSIFTVVATQVKRSERLKRGSKGQGG